MTGYLFSAAGFSLLLSLLTIYHILRYKHREAASAVLWIFVVFSFPFVGPLLYFLFGINRVTVKGLYLEAAKRRLLDRSGTGASQVLRKRADHIGRFGSLPCWPPSYAQAAQALDRQLEDMPVLVGNQIVLLRNGDEAYPAMLEAILEARSSIHLETYIFRPDRIGRRVMEALVAKARSGVQVRFLYDRLGSSGARLSGYLDVFRDVPNMQIGGHALIHPLKRRLQINLRNHRKLLVVDGRFGFLGGINIHEENTASLTQEAQILDYHFQVEGPVVSELQYCFLQDWFYTTEEDPESLLRDEFFPALTPRADNCARVVRSGPGPDFEAIHRAFFTLVVMAQRSIKLMTPYFVPDAPLLTALLNAAARGLDVRLILPQRTNHWYIHYAARSFYAPLLEAGVRIFETPPPFLHAKALLVDNQWALVGSANFDIRSFRLNFELNLEALGPFAEQTLRSALDEEMDRSREMELRAFEKRPHWEPLMEGLCGLASPIL